MSSIFLENIQMIAQDVAPLEVDPDLAADSKSKMRTGGCELVANMA
jgi:hypothetical protein